MWCAVCLDSVAKSLPRPLSLDSWRAEALIAAIKSDITKAAQCLHEPALAALATDTALTAVASGAPAPDATADTMAGVQTDVETPTA